MTVQFEELGAGHPVYATYWIAKHFEEAGRKLLLPFLEAGDGGIGTEVHVNHWPRRCRACASTVTATALRTEGRRLHAELKAVSELGDWSPPDRPCSTSPTPDDWNRASKRCAGAGPSTSGRTSTQGEHSCVI